MKPYYTLLDTSDRTRIDRVATRTDRDALARLGLRYRAAQPYPCTLSVQDPAGHVIDFDEWLGTFDSPIMIGGI